MKKYSGSFKSYSIDELSEKAKENAYNKWYQHADYPCGSDAEGTLKEFCRLFDVKVTKWKFDAYSHDYRFSIENDNVEGLRGIRLATYIWNNYAKYITKGEYYHKKGKSRRSKVNMSMQDCPLTGYCLDCDILDSIIDCLHYTRLYEGYEQLVNECLNTFFKACSEDAGWCTSEEYFIDEAHANEYEYDKNGNVFSLPIGFQETV